MNDPKTASARRVPASRALSWSMLAAALTLSWACQSEAPSTLTPPVIRYEACGGKTCGDPCTACDPLNTNCVEPAPRAKVCDRAQRCIPAAEATCTDPEDAGTTMDAAPADAGPGLDARSPDARSPDAQVSDAGPPDTGVTVCTDTFTQHAQPMVDILFVVDDSCSMGDDQIVLAQGFGDMMSNLSQSNVDFQIGVTTTDVSNSGPAGQLVGNPAILTPQTPSLAAAFSANVRQGTDGSQIEQGLEATRLALSAGRNPGFVREDAALLVIYLSDENDQSPDLAADYLSFLVGIHGAHRLLVNTIVGDLPRGCPIAAAAPRYDVLRAATNGTFASICTQPFTPALTNLGGSGFGLRSRFTLARPAPGGVVSVTVDGQNIPASSQGSTRWTYNAATNTLTFTAFSLPEPGTSIVVISDC